ncbi:unnamed protein product [Haemonchus placei]|uniref:F-box domain-containing protein n=1 Tax=Haemonchus placei TaxID=6290 RepID=A0A0N4WJB8_HAEPC|nr:unnamed protein product [Haemonchus placei]
MSKRNCRESEPVEAYCFLVAANFTEQGHVSVPAGPAKNCNVSRSNDEAIAKVYNNDMLMRHIVSFVTDINTLNSYVSVEIGDVWFVLPSTTLDNRRDKNKRCTTQPLKLMNTLYGMAERFALGITNVRLGGAELWSAGVQNHQLIVTADLLRFINDRLKNLRSISFRHCGFDECAMGYLSSMECSLPDRIRELSICGVWFDRNPLISEFSRLITPSLRVLKLETFKVGQLGSMLLDRVRNQQMVLDDIHIQLSPSSLQGVSVNALRNFLNDVSAVTREFRIDVHSPRRSGEILLFAIRNITFLTNIAELRLFVQPSSRTEAENVTHIFNHLGKLPNLRKFACGNWKSYDVTAALSNGLRFCFLLRDLEICCLSTLLVSTVQGITVINDGAMWKSRDANCGVNHRFVAIRFFHYSQEMFFTGVCYSCLSQSIILNRASLRVKSSLAFAMKDQG